MGERVSTFVRWGTSLQAAWGRQGRAQTEVCGGTGLGAVSCRWWLVLQRPPGATAPSMPQEDSGQPSALSGGTLVGPSDHYDTCDALPACELCFPWFSGPRHGRRREHSSRSGPQRDPWASPLHPVHGPRACPVPCLPARVSTGSPPLPHPLGLPSGRTLTCRAAFSQGPQGDREAEGSPECRQTSFRPDCE